MLRKDWNLYLITEEQLSEGRSTLEVVKEAVNGGVDVIQLRDKNLTLRERYSLGREIKKITKKSKVDFIVNDRVDLAAVLDADGVHLGQDDLPCREARRILGADKIIGITSIKTRDIIKAEKDGADYLGIGSVYKTNSKIVAEEKDGIGLEGIKKVKKITSLPVIAVGGLNSKNAADVIRAGADAVSVISSLTGADDIKSSAENLKEIIRKAKKEKWSKLERS